jgi:hypothetical protein
VDESTRRNLRLVRAPALKDHIPVHFRNRLPAALRSCSRSLAAPFSPSHLRDLTPTFFSLAYKVRLPPFPSLSGYSFFLLTRSTPHQL